jgi:hypothetical protein
MSNPAAHGGTIDEARIAGEILRLVAERGPDRSICPSEAARALAPDWQRLMGPVRRVAIGLARQGRIEILRKGRPVPEAEVRGVIRLRLRSGASGPGVSDPGANDPGANDPGGSGPGET